MTIIVCLHKIRPLQRGCVIYYPILVRQKDFDPLDLVHHAHAIPPRFWNGVDWRALAKLCSPDIGKKKERKNMEAKYRKVM